MPTHGIDVRDPFQSEMEWFGDNPDIPGMATEDYMVTLNPFMDLTEQKKKAIIKNEMARAYMRKYKLRPKFQITPEQHKYFSTLRNGKPYGSEQDIMETIVGRIISGDPSVGQATPEQHIFSSMLGRLLEQ